jgi:pSer/pThr/pTyr-binding forkhead associated (FHA) protein
VLKLGGHFNISSSLLLIGRSCGQTPTEIDHYLRNTPGVSRRHCLIVGGSTAITVVDLASTNGTFVGSRRVSPGEPCRIDRQQLPVSLGLGSGVLCMIEARS